MDTIIKIWKLIKPLIIPALIIIAYFQEVIFTNDISNTLLVIIFILYLFLHGKQIITGAEAISSIGGGGIKPPPGGKTK